jgi:phospholipid/cholesterol/gamma-HCH transport system substrate-binding protein
MNTFDAILRTQRGRIESILENVDGMSAGMDTLLAANGDSLAVTVGRLNAALATMDSTLAGVDEASAGLSQLLAKLNSNEGTMGRLINDPALYDRTDSLLTSLNSLLLDFQTNPGRYLKEMRIVDLF